MKGIRVDPEARTARVQAGVLWGELDHETQAFGLATTGGIVTHTGVAGLTLGGGIGWLQRKYGLTVDNLLAADVVTADGELVKASPTENADLFWGLRGGGGNFGIVTEFEFRLHPVGPQVVAGPIFWPIEESPRLLRFYRDWIAEAPDELMTIVLHRKAPAVPFVPSELHGQLVVAVACCYAGPIEEGEKAMRPLKEFGSPVLDLCVPKPYVAASVDVRPVVPARVVVLRPRLRRRRAHGRGDRHHRRPLDANRVAADVVPDLAAGRSSRARRRGRDRLQRTRRRTHVQHRRATETAEGFDAERNWSRTFWSALEPHHTSVYVNFLMDEGEERIRQAYGPAKYDRLKALKRRYDPDNLFRLNQNIPPA